MAGRYDVFLCHNQADKPAVEELENRLHAAGLKSWLDKSDLRRGVHWTAEVEKCLTEECNCCAVIVGPSGLGPWQQQELRLALDRQVEAGRRNGSFPVIPVLLPGGTPETLPPFLKGNTYVAFSKTLDNEEAFDELVRAIRGLPPNRSRPISGECPYRGLEFFDVAHAPYFHGREALTQRLLDKLFPGDQNPVPTRFLAIIGASGSGKSSLARAGLVAALERGAIKESDEWPVVISRPGLDPCANLAIELAKRGGLDLDKRAEFKDRLKDRMRQDPAALHESVQLILPSDDPKRRMVILIDQFEELFTICQDEALRRAFIENLLYASQVLQGRTVVLLVMRADFYGKCAGYPQLALVVPERQVLVGPMTPTELREAIEKPAQQVGCELEPGLVDLLLKEVADQPGSLPYLQFALRELWNKKSGRRLTTDAYRTIGGVTGALQRKADEVYSRLSEPQQLICRRIFLRLTQPGEGAEDTKRRVSLSELRPPSGSMAEVEAVLFNLTEAETRLVTGEAVNGQQFVEVAHEALIRGWPQLRTWIEADRTALRTQRRLTESANQWNDNHRDGSFLYRGARLGTAEEWARAHPEELNSLESEFINLSRWQARGQKIKIAAAASFVVLAGALGWLLIRHQAIEESNRTHAAALVEQLLDADIAEVPAIVQKLPAYRHWADPLLRQEDAEAAHDHKKELHLALALLPVDEGKIAELDDRLRLVSPSEFPVVREALLPYKSQVVEPLWNVALDSSRDVQQRFQAACALASFSPGDPRWDRIKTFVARRLVSLEASALVAWREVLRPAKVQLIGPLAAIYRDRKQKEQARTYATETLADYASDRPEELFDLLADAEEFQFPALFDKLAAHKAKAVTLASKELDKPPVPAATEDQKELLAKRQANAAVALLRLGTPERVWTILKESPDPRVQSYVIDWLSPRGGEPQPLLKQLDVETDATIRQALVRALGEFSDTQLPSAQRQPLIEKLLVVYRDEPNAGLHGAVEWLLRKWGQGRRLEGVAEKLQSDEKQLQARKSSEKRHWYINTQKQTFVILDAGDFVMGSPEWEPDHQQDERLHLRKIERRFAIAAHEVTKSEFDRFSRTRTAVAKTATGDSVITDDTPQVALTWYEAVHYCNWLSEREGISKAEWCYEPNRQGMYAAGMKAKDKFWERTGYRLPTEAEWEYACRAGTVTSRYYGLSTQLLPQFAWYVQDGDNHTWPIGKLEPNGWGLVDMLGNAMEWCYDPPVPYPTQANSVVDDRPATRPVDDAVRRAVRGGAFNFLPRSVRSAYRNYFAPDTPIEYIGFRPVRTYP